MPEEGDCLLTISRPSSICFPVASRLRRSIWLDFFCAQASGPRNPIARKVRHPMIKMRIGSLHVCASAANTTIVSRNAQSVLRTIKKKYVLREQYITCLRRATSFKIFRRADLLPDRAHRQRTTCSTNRCSTWRNSSNDTHFVAQQCCNKAPGSAGEASQARRNTPPPPRSPARSQRGRAGEIERRDAAAPSTKSVASHSPEKNLANVGYPGPFLKFC